MGDEIVISWKMHEGVDKANCLNCFFEIQQTLRLKAPYYKESYDGIIPKFKAGLHCGYVVAGEIGVVKRDIVFSGDVLNTASRIQEYCNKLNKQLLVSESLANELVKYKYLEIQPVGELELRGKEGKSKIYGVEKLA